MLGTPSGESELGELNCLLLHLRETEKKLTGLIGEEAPEEKRTRGRQAECLQLNTKEEEIGRFLSGPLGTYLPH